MAAAEEPERREIYWRVPEWPREEAGPSVDAALDTFRGGGVCDEH